MYQGILPLQTCILMYQMPHIKVFLVSVLTFTLLFVVIPLNAVAQLCQNKSFKFSFGWIFYSFWQTERSLLRIWNIAKTTKTISTTKKPSWIPSCKWFWLGFCCFIFCLVYFFICIWFASLFAFSIMCWFDACLILNSTTPRKHITFFPNISQDIEKSC